MLLPIDRMIKSVEQGLPVSVMVMAPGGAFGLVPTWAFVKAISCDILPGNSIRCYRLHLDDGYNVGPHDVQRVDFSTGQKPYPKKEQQ